MSLRMFFNTNGLLIVSAFALCVSGGALAAEAKLSTPRVQTYVEQAVPMDAPDSQAHLNSPLAAGSLTLEDVLEAHRHNKAGDVPPLPAVPSTAFPTATAPVLTPSAGSSTTGLMISQGMKSVLQKVEPSAATSALTQDVSASAPIMQDDGQSQATEKPKSLASGLNYKSGREPKNLATLASVAEADTPAQSSTSSYAEAKEQPVSGQPCTQNVEKWEKTCVEAGYPATYVGKIAGETRVSCPDGSLNDFWITNTCAPPKASSDEPDIIDGICGSASGVASKSAPASDLCHSGSATLVKGTGPWEWSCKGNKQGRSESCSAPIASVAPVVTEPSVEAPSESVITPAEAVEETVPVIVPEADESKAESSSPAFQPAEAELPQAPAGVGDEFCGVAAETLASTAPEKGLCRVGTASAVNGSGPWTWSCTNNEGVESSCRTLSLRNDSSAETQPIPSESAATAESTAVKAAPRAKVEASPSTKRTLPSPDSSSAKSSLVKPATEAKTRAGAPAAKPLPYKKGSSASELNSFDAPPTPSHVPDQVDVVSDSVPAVVPDVSEGAEPPSPQVKDAMPSTPVLQKPVVKGQASGGHVVLDPTVSAVLFTKGSETIEPNVLTTLNKLVAILQKNPDVRISLVAYADSVGTSPREAHRLSLNRALAVRDYLSSHGVSESRADVSAQGADGSIGYMDRVDVKVND